MKFTTLTGRVRTVPKSQKYLIDWCGNSKSIFQKKVKLFLKDYWSYDIVFEEFPVAGTKMSFDFYNSSKKIVVEAHGKQHGEYTPYFHNKNVSNFIDQLRRDSKKEDFCRLNGLEFIEVYDKEDDFEKLKKMCNTI